MLLNLLFSLTLRKNRSKRRIDRCEVTITFKSVLVVLKKKTLEERAVIV